MSTLCLPPCNLRLLTSRLPRSYLLDVSRVTPRDANWVHGVKGTGAYDDWLAVRENSEIGQRVGGRGDKW